MSFDPTYQSILRFMPPYAHQLRRVIPSMISWTHYPVFNLQMAQKCQYYLTLLAKALSITPNGDDLKLDGELNRYDNVFTHINQSYALEANILQCIKGFCDQKCSLHLD